MADSPSKQWCCGLPFVCTRPLTAQEKDDLVRRAAADIVMKKRSLFFLALSLVLSVASIVTSNIKVPFASAFALACAGCFAGSVLGIFQECVWPRYPKMMKLFVLCGLCVCMALIGKMLFKIKTDSFISIAIAVLAVLGQVVLFLRALDSEKPLFALRRVFRDVRQGEVMIFRANQQRCEGIGLPDGRSPELEILPQSRLVVTHWGRPVQKWIRHAFDTVPVLPGVSVETRQIRNLEPTEIKELISAGRRMFWARLAFVFPVFIACGKFVAMRSERRGVFDFELLAIVTSPFIALVVVWAARSYLRMRREWRMGFVRVQYLEGRRAEYLPVTGIWWSCEGRPEIWRREKNAFIIGKRVALQKGYSIQIVSRGECLCYREAENPGIDYLFGYYSRFKKVEVTCDGSMSLSAIFLRLQEDKVIRKIAPRIREHFKTKKVVFIDERGNPVEI